tara:strand:+ start:608 stop:3187 length:2580 start_codon:yes stop_codon:yes gene_type:complete
MPKIPMVERQGVLATGGLGPRANVGAFTAPGQALAGLGKTASDIQFRFHMAEKEAETEKAQQEIATSTNQNFNNFTNSSEATTVQQYQDDAEAYKKKLRQENLEPLRKKLTKRQFQKVESEFNKTVAAKVATGSQVAFAKHQRIRADQVNTTIEDTMSQMRGLDKSSALYQQLQQNLDDGFDRWAAQGLNLKYNKGGYRKELSASAFENQIQSADTQADIDRMRGTLAAERPDMTAKQFALRDAAITAQEKIVDDRQVQAIMDQLVNESPETFLDDAEVDKVIQDIRDGKVIDVKNNAGELVSVDFQNMKAENRRKIISRIEARANSEKAETLSANLNSIDKKIAKSSLGQLQNMEDQITATGPDGKFLIAPDITDFQDRQKIKSLINASIRDKAVKAVADSQQVLRDTSAALAASKDGTLTQAQEDAAAAAIVGLENAEQYDQANKMRVELAAMKSAGADFLSIEFGSVAQQTAIINEAKANRGTEQGARTYEILQERLAARNKAVKDNFVGYYNEKRPDDPKTPSELVTMQLQMGVAPGDVRVTSNADLAAFQAEYNAEGNTSMDKARVLDQFVQQYGVENENRVMRHLMSSNVISFSEHLRAAYPEQINMQSVVDGNEEANISNAKAKLTSDVRNQVDEIVRDTVDDYASSVMGGIRDGVIGVGGDANRTSHIIKMQDTIANTAKHLMATRTIDPEEAVNIAYEAVIGNHFVFENINDSQMRVPTALSDRARDISTVLQHSAFEDQDYLKSRIIFPATPEGRSEEDFQNEYLQDLRNSGSWRTTVDNKGVFLVDQLGNLVPMKPSDDLIPPEGMDGFSGFVSVPFSSVLPLADQYRDMEGVLKGRLNKIFSQKKLF